MGGHYQLSHSGANQKLDENWRRTDNGQTKMEGFSHEYVAILLLKK